MFSGALAWSIAAGAGTAVGALILFVKRKWEGRGLSFFLGLAAGVMLAVVVLDLLPSVLVAGNLQGGLWGLGWGMILLGLVDRLFLAESSSSRSLTTLGYLIMVGIALHDFPEGMAIALGEELKERTGMVIALGIGIHNIPEGMAIAAPLLMGGISRLKILLQVLLVGLVTPMGTVVGQLAVAYIPWCFSLLLGLASGAMTYLVLFQLWPEARRHRSYSRHVGFWLGVALIAAATYI